MPLAARTPHGACDEVERDGTTNDADNRRKQHEPDIVLNNDTGKDLHWRLPEACTHEISGTSLPLNRQQTLNFGHDQSVGGHANSRTKVGG